MRVCPGRRDGHLSWHSSDPEEVAAFCDRVDELGDVSGTELMLGLIEVAPTEVRPAIRRASELGSSTFEDDLLIDEWLERCRT